MQAVGFTGTLEHDVSKPDGTPRKLMSNGKLAAMGWSPQISLPDGLKSTYCWFLANRAVTA
jgi:GDP-L-fucose synthase